MIKKILQGSLILLLIAGCSGSNSTEEPLYEAIRVSSENETYINTNLKLEYEITNYTPSKTNLNLPIKVELLSEPDIGLFSGSCLNEGILPFNDKCQLILTLNKISEPQVLNFLFKISLNGKDQILNSSIKIKKAVIDDIKGGDKTICILSQETVYCKGQDLISRPYVSGKIDLEFKKIDIPNVKKLENYFNGGFCIVNNHKELYCWNRYQVIHKKNVENVDYVSIAQGEICIISVGRAYCLNNQNQLISQPYFLDDQTVEITGGDDHTCMRSKSNQVFCWGKGGQGQLGSGLQVDENSPQLVFDRNTLLSLKNVTQISSAGNYNCAIHSFYDYNRVSCWGKPGRHLGNGEMKLTAEPIFDTAYSPLVDKIILSTAQLSIITKNGLVYSQGYNENGQLGFSTEREEIPYVYNSQYIEPILKLGTFYSQYKVKNIVHGSGYSCVLTFDDDIKCFGAIPW